MEGHGTKNMNAPEIHEAPRRRQFASDNWSGICPEAWQALERANADHVPAYGEDPYTQRAADAIREFFEADCEVFFVFSGTAANSLALASLSRSYHSVICHERAHIETDECGAPEFFSNGTKILTVPGDDGKVDLVAVESTVTRRSDIHYPKPQVLSLTQATELGGVYSLQQLQDATALARDLGLRVHMDGSRLANAIASLGVSPAEVTWKSGVDVLCFGGAKGGMPLGDAVVFFDRDLAFEFDYRCKQSGQLASKTRFLAAPWIGMLESGALLTHAAHANRMARLLAEELGNVSGVQLSHPCEANSVFVELEERVQEGLRERGWIFYTFIGSGQARLMCSWDTTEEDVRSFAADLNELVL